LKGTTERTDREREIAKRTHREREPKAEREREEVAIEDISTYLSLSVTRTLTPIDLSADILLLLLFLDAVSESIAERGTRGRKEEVYSFVVPLSPLSSPVQTHTHTHTHSSTLSVYIYFRLFCSSQLSSLSLYRKRGRECVSAMASFAFFSV
jgi:hypothetical protein